jgi:hypothetical protein
MRDRKPQMSTRIIARFNQPIGTRIERSTIKQPIHKSPDGKKIGRRMSLLGIKYEFIFTGKIVKIHDVNSGKWHTIQLDSTATINGIEFSFEK